MMRDILSSRTCFALCKIKSGTASVKHMAMYVIDEITDF